MKELSIIPECYVDTKVAEIVAQASGKFNHQHGCGDVANQLRIRFKDKIGLGIIDEDKSKGPSAKYFSDFEIMTTENSLILKKHKERKQYLILICPEIEKWLLNDAKVANLNPEEFGLPYNLIGFKQITKTQDIDKNIGFYRFMKALIKQESPAITTLGNWITLFNENKLDDLKMK